MLGSSFSSDTETSLSLPTCHLQKAGTQSATRTLVHTDYDQDLKQLPHTAGNAAQALTSVVQGPKRPLEAIPIPPKS